MKNEVERVFKEFYYKGKFERSHNATSFKLILKKEGGKDLKGFRPISLEGDPYKIVAEVSA